MSLCGALGCNHNNLRERCSFYKLPTEPKLRAKWLQLLGRDPENIPKVLKVCSCHFKDGNKDNGPELLSFNESENESENSEKLSSPERKKFRTKLLISPERPELEILESTSLQLSTQEIETREMEPAVESFESTFTTEKEAQEMFRDVATNTDFVDINAPSTSRGNSTILMEAEIDLLKSKVEKLEKKLKEKLSYKDIKDHNNLIVLYTGLPDAKIFDMLLNLLKDLKINYYYKYRVVKISVEDQLLLTLMKLRQNLPHEDLAFRFGISLGYVSNIILTWIHVLHEVLYLNFMKKIPSREKNKTCLPSSFSSFPNCRIILDCTEIFIEVPRKSMKEQKLTYSHYKHRNTLKGLVGVAPNGVITFLSDLFAGSISDKSIVQQSGILDQLEPGDLVIADKGFLISDILPLNVQLNIPPFLTTPQFAKEQVQITEKIARARIHVERAIRRMKCFKILKCIPTPLIKHSNIIFKVVGALTNFKYPLIEEVDPLFNFEEFDDE